MHPLDIIKIESPSELYATVVHPQIELKTSDARSVLKQTVSLKSAIMQWGNVGGLIAGLYTKDYDLIGRSLHDEIVEPLRSVLIPGFDLIKQTAYRKRCFRFWNFRFWTFYFCFKQRRSNRQ